MGGRASAEALKFAVAVRNLVKYLDGVADSFATLVDKFLNHGVRRADAQDPLGEVVEGAKVTGVECALKGA